MANHDDIAIKVQNVSKTFKLPHEKQASIKSSLIHLGHTKGYELQKALEDISFEIKKGEFFGIVGRNGSGKSTLLKLLAGIYSPTKGSIQVEGKLTPFIELGVGFNPELTGRENVFLNGALLGFNRKEMTAMYDEIVEFAELERFMDQKLKNYSSGMQVRLAFSIAIRAESDILLLDEVLAVGDAAFQKKCFDFFRQLKKDKKTVVFISHDMNAIREYCDRAVLLEESKIIHAGTADEVAKKYTKLFQSTSSYDGGNEKKWGTGGVSAKNIKTKLGSEVISIDVDYKFTEDVDDPIFGLTIMSPIGVRVFESNTKWQHTKTGKYKQGDVVKISWEIPNIFTNGTNYVSVAVANKDATQFYDWWDEATCLLIDKDEVTTAVTMPPHNIGIHRNA